MGLFIGNREELRARIGREGTTQSLWAALAERVKRHTAAPGVVQDGDTQEWWHLAWERLGDAAFAAAVKPEDEVLRKWLRETVLDVCGKPADEWTGPWFRTRSEPPIGTLETAHAAIAVATAIDCVPELFGAEELTEIGEALRAKGLEPCRRALLAYAQAERTANNWFMVLLNGFGTAAAALGDREAVAEAAGYYRTAAALYNGDSYGESLQYSNYATLHLSHLREVLTRYDAAWEDELDIGCYARLMPWYASSFLYTKPLAGWGADAYPRSVNFGDSSAIFRPSADVLLHVAARGKERFPAEAGLARWLFDTLYADPRQGAEEGASFGFMNHFQLLSILLADEAAEPLSPERAGLPLLSPFETGSVVARDRWEQPVTVLAVQGGFEPLRVSSHRHEDQNSFMLTHLQERFFVDPGHCCYRLRTQSVSRAEFSHNTWSFEAEGEDGLTVAIRQHTAGGNALQPTRLFNRRRIARELDGIHVVRADAAELYGGPIRKAERTWIAAMPHTLFIVDRIEADVPIKVRSHFVLNNRDNRLKAKIAAETKLVFRRNAAGMKFFQVSATSGGEVNRNILSQDWGYVHDCYNPLPNRQGQGAEGSASIFRYTSGEFRTEHTIVYAIAMDDTDTIRQWHIRPLTDRHVYVEPPAKKGGYSLKLAEDGEWIVLRHDDDSRYSIGPDRFTRAF